MWAKDASGDVTGLARPGGSLKNVRPKSTIEIIGQGYSGPMSSTSVAGYTWQQVVAAKSHAMAARIGYMNLTAADYTVDKTSITPSTTYTGGGSTYDPTGSATPVNVLFSGGAPAVVPAGSTAEQGSILSDWTAIDPLARTDVAGGYHLWHIRSYIANAGAAAYPYATSTNYATYAGNTAAGRVWMTGFMSGDKIGTPAGFTANNGVALGMTVEFKTFSRQIRVVSIGDSITSGQAATATPGGAFNNFVDGALAIINPTALDYGTIFSHVNGGISSQTLPQFTARLANILTHLTPEIVVLPVWSPNTCPSTAAQLAVNNNLILTAIDAILAAGAVPVLWTALPRNTVITSGQDGLRLSNNAFWRTVAATDSFILADFAASMDGALSGGVTQYIPAYSSDDTHPNAAGQAVMSAILAAALRRVVAL